MRPGGVLLFLTRDILSFRSLNLPGDSPEPRVDEPADIKPDAALLSMLETPSKGFNVIFSYIFPYFQFQFEDSGVFDETLNMNFQFATSPLKHLFLDFDTPQPGPSSTPDPLLDPFMDDVSPPPPPPPTVPVSVRSAGKEGEDRSRDDPALGQYLRPASATLVQTVSGSRKSPSSIFFSISLIQMAP